MKQSAPVDLMRVAPAVYGHLDLVQVALLGAGSLCALAAILGRAPVSFGIAAPALGAALALLEVDGQALRRLLPLWLRCALRRLGRDPAGGDDPLRQNLRPLAGRARRRFP